MKQIRNGCAFVGIVGMLIVFIHHSLIALPDVVMKWTSLVLSIALAMMLFCMFTMWHEGRQNKTRF